MQEKIKNKFVRYRVATGFLFCLFYLFFAPVTSKVFLIIGTIITLLGEGIRLWASGYLYKGEILATSGPYCFCRHPLYLGSFLIGVGFCLISTSRIYWIRSIIFWLIFLILFALIYSLTIKKEEEFLKTKFKEEFLNYQQKVPLITFKLKKELWNQKYSFERMEKNGEIKTFLLIILGLIIIISKYIYL